MKTVSQHIGMAAKEELMVKSVAIVAGAPSLKALSQHIGRPVFSSLLYVVWCPQAKRNVVAAVA
jgi:hypothetical protein